MGRALIFYNSRNKDLKEALLTHLNVLTDNGKLGLWSEDDIPPGADVRRSLAQALDDAALAILLITADYLASRLSGSAEVEILLERARRGLIVYPLLALPCAWEAVSWLAPLQIRPQGGQPVWREGGKYADQDLASTTREVLRLIGTPITLGPSPTRPTKTADEVIRATIAELGASGGPLTVVSSILQQTISVGASAYNSGYEEYCAELYRNVAGQLAIRKDLVKANSGLFDATSMPHSRAKSRLSGMPVESDARPGRGDGREPEAAAVAELAWASAASHYDKPVDVKSHAWRLRHAFDRVICLAATVTSIRAIGADALSRDRRATMRRVVHEALDASDVIYAHGVGSMADRERAIHTIAVLLCYVLHLHAGAVAELALCSSYAGRQLAMRMQDLLEMWNDGDRFNYYQMAWDARHALQCLVSHELDTK